MKTLLATALVLLCSLSVPGGVLADDTPAAKTGVVLIFDDSGSMAERVGHQTRMDLAKQVTEKSFVAKLNLELSMGLIFLNHADRNLPLAPGSAWVVEPRGEQAGSCQKNEIMERVAGCSAHGGTPLTEAVRTARGYFQGKELTRKIIVVITDGEAANPASFSAELDASLKEQFELYAIGFCFETEAGGKALRDKLNTEGRTRFFDATGTADSLAQAFQSILTAGNLEAQKD